MIFKMHRLRNQSPDDDDIMSSISQNSYLPNCFNPSVNSDTESVGGLSVRDMVKRYNSAAKMNGHLGNYCNSTTGSRSSININPPVSYKARNINMHQSLPMNQSVSNYNITGYGSQTNLRRNNSIIDEEEQMPKLNCCKACSECPCCQNHCRNLLNSSKSTQDSQAVDGQAAKPAETPSVQHSRSSEQLEKQRSALDNSDDSAMQPIESSYHSKTTIAKTANGVRIIIDIFFDQEQCATFNARDVIGSRVETDIPHSRILNEFQRQTLIASGLVSGMVSNSASGTFNHCQY